MKNFVFTINNGYVEHLLVVLTSVLENNKNIHIYILHKDITLENMKKIVRIVSRYKSACVDFVQVDENKFRDLKLNISYISVETYFRYLLADVLPYVDKCLYLDADIIVNGKLDKLYQINLDDFYCAGVEDCYIKEINYKSFLKLGKDDIYVNAGVLLFNLQKIREDALCEKMFQMTRELGEKIKYQDQDIINLVFKGKILVVDAQYNFASYNLIKMKKKRKYAKIIHFTGPDKPWLVDSKHSMKCIWLKYEKIMNEFSILRKFW